MRNPPSILPLLNLALCSLLLSSCHREGNESTASATLVNLRDWGLSPEATAAENREALQRAIDWASPRGAALWLDPSEHPYPILGGIVLKKNVSLVGGNGPVPRGTAHPERNHPVGSVFSITDRENPFIMVDGATRIEGIQFYYPEQARIDPEKIIPYPPTITKIPDARTFGITLSRLTFFGEYMAIDFKASRQAITELMTIEHCYGYPLSGQFIRIDYCYDIPRILNCHVNPSIQRYFARDEPRLSHEVIQAVIDHKTYAFSIDHTDNAQLIDVFTFGTYGGVHLGPASYGQLTNFNLDCVTVGIWKQGDSTKNRNWMVAQGSIIANVGATVEEVHPIIVEGQGHLALANVEAFSGGNRALQTIDISHDYMLVRGDEKLTVSMVGCRMRNYQSDHPLTIENPNAAIRAVACLDKNEEWFETIIPADRP